MASGTFNNDQASLVLNQVVPLSGSFPLRPNGVDDFNDDEQFGFIRTFADISPSSDPLAQGQTLPIQQNLALFSLLGTTYGGNGSSTFGLPSLGGRVQVGVGGSYSLGEQTGTDTGTVTAPEFPANLGGTSQPVNDVQPTLAVEYVIRVNGDRPDTAGASGITGEVLAFLGNFVPDGYVLANGQLLSMADNPELFAVIGKTYGGTSDSFAVPNLMGRNIVGAHGALQLGATVGQDGVVLTQANEPVAQGGAGTPFNNQSAGLALNYIICTTGVYPSRGNPLGEESYLGEVRAYAGAQIPTGWMLAQGQLLPITQNTALFSLFGTTYGGNGTTTFALPDLRDRVAVGADNTHTLGSTYGANTATLTVTDGTACFCRGTAILAEQGEVAVEQLAVGDRMVTASGAVRPIRWIGRRCYAGRFLRANRAVQPVLFRAGSLGGGLPRRDLHVSPLHAMFLDGVLVPAELLVNGTTIIRDQVDRVEYFHVELDTHDVLLAEGAPSESYVDDNNRGIFHNAAERQAIDPVPAIYYAPRVESGFQLEVIRARLATVASQSVLVA